MLTKTYYYIFSTFFALFTSDKQCISVHTHVIPQQAEMAQGVPGRLTLRLPD